MLAWHQSRNSSQGQSSPARQLKVVLLLALDQAGIPRGTRLTLRTASLAALDFGLCHWHLIARVVLATHKENLDMTKNQTSLVELKLAVIKYHNANAYTEVSIARDACYTSFNSINFKKTGNGQMSDVAAEIKDLLPQRGQEVTDVKLAKLLDRYEGMEQELATLEERHAADCEVYHQISGEKWLNKPKRTHVATGHGLDSRLAKFA
jgi:hypothetical protein